MRKKGKGKPKGGSKRYLNESDVATELESGFKKRRDRFDERFLEYLMENWVKPKKASRSIPLPVLNQRDCNAAADEWWRWALTSPVSASPFYNLAQSPLYVPYLFNKGGEANGISKVYMIGVTAFKKPDVVRIAIRERAPILIPIYNVIAAAEEIPGKVQAQTELKRTVVNDLCGLYSMEATYDGDPIQGCAVLRNDPLKIEYVPRDNVMGIPEERMGEENTVHVCHGGFYVMLNHDKGSNAMTIGDHLLSFKAYSVNYEIEAKVHINVLTN